jgi:signal transduction histidine kinase
VFEDITDEAAPLALIMTAGEVSLCKQRSRKELAEVLRKIVREARHMSKLVENLLDLARGDARRRHTELAPAAAAKRAHSDCGSG